LLESLFPNVDIADWARRVADVIGSRAVLEALALQISVITGMLLLAWGLRAASRPWTAQLVAIAERRFPSLRIAAMADAMLPLFYAWLLLALAASIGGNWYGGWRLVAIAADLAALWLVLRVSTTLLHHALIARLIVTVAWVVFTLDLLGALGAAESALDTMAVTIGALRLSMLLVLKALIVVALLLWLATALSRLIIGRLQHVAGLSLSVQLLIGNLIRIALISIALVVGLSTVGIDLTAFTVFSGAIGVGVGFGLQKIVSNFVSGIILLVESSIKPGDVIEIGDTFGNVISLGARYAAVRGRDGKEYLIPNENLITNQVINWSYSSPLVRVDAAFGVGYASNLRQVRALAIDAAKQTERVVAEPPPVCHITGFGDSAVNLLLRFWIEDPSRGVINVKGDVYLAVWEAFEEHGIELPLPQRELHLRTWPTDFALEPDAAKPQRIADDQQRTRAHCRTGDHRAQEDAG
jgi:small-conductance mechanosensitive channel